MPTQPRRLSATGSCGPGAGAERLRRIARCCGRSDCCCPAGHPPAANADPARHTVVYRILGGGDVYSVIPDPGTAVYPASTTTWVPVPWSQTVKVTGSPYLALNYTDKSGGPHDCAIEVDGQPVALTEHKAGRCAYQIPGPAQ